ncbi:hypothetical protein I8752_09425 [Nostocaceae cyanobacterium CENA369]|uniref:Uncharacterized protein n=1 Tax=Dendronalium phyllosphericum CENA369 TaxID=1725256 RepID=A0A8J7LGR1_9NOST|nr:hypothetical protein [Dendronalium phyllosphericum]MBH8573234.1 hypothetical protein [Dendronalium phyllosphericum CENA369]
MRFTVFTFLYLAAGVCLTVVILEHPDIAPNHKISLLVNAGLLYFAAVLSTFRFWRQGVLRSEARLRDKPAWDRNFVMFLPIFLIVVMLVITIPDLVNHNWSMEAIAKASVGPLLILISVEQLFIRSQIRRES